MPSVVFVKKWRLFFYSNEGFEPMHIHAEKAEMECKFWLIPETTEILEAWSFNLTPAAKHEIIEIIYSNFDIIVSSWNSHFKK